MKRKWVFNLLIVICAGVFIFAAYQLGKALWAYHENSKLQNELQNIFHANESQPSAKPEESGEESGDGEESRTDDTTVSNGLKTLYAMNPDLIGWLQIPCADVDHPVMQAEDNDFYLHRDFYKNYRYAGTLFVDYRSNVQAEGQNTIIYGHHMIDGSMLGRVDRLLKYDTYQKNKTFTLRTMDGTYECQIFAAFSCTTAFPYIQTSFYSDQQFEEYVAMCRAESVYDTEVTVSPGDRILTISTCNGRYDDGSGRTVIQAKMARVADK